MTKITIPSAAEIAKFSTEQMVACFNELRDLIPEEDRPKPVVRFRTKESGRNRVKNLAKLAAKALKGAVVKLERPKKVAAQVVMAPEEKKGGSGRRRRGVNLEPPELKGPLKDGPTSCLIGSKQAKLVDTLSKEGGATMPELLKAMNFGRKPWTEQNIRSGFGWDMKLHGYGVRSEVIDGVERFFLVVPKGYKVVPHRERKTAVDE